MTGGTIILSDVLIKSAHDIDEKALIDFYEKAYPGRANSRIWKWLNRSYFYKNKIPLITTFNNKIIAHAGMIPITVSLGTKRFNASWFIDFTVLPEFQRHGIGSFLTKEWMKFSDLYITFCNEKSMGVFKKYGWIESFETNLHRYFLRPFNYDKLAKLIPLHLRNLLNVISGNIITLLYRKYSLPIEKWRIEEVDSNSINRFLTAMKMPEHGVLPLRDIDYASWRILNSPDKDKYRLFNSDGINVLFKLCDKSRFSYIDILWISNNSQHSAVRDAIATISSWGMLRDYSYLRHYVSGACLSAYLHKYLKSVITHPRFAFYSNNSALLEELKHSEWHWELIDSDFEEF